MNNNFIGQQPKKIILVPDLIINNTNQYKLN
jgi:hypothetical protein